MPNRKNGIEDVQKKLELLDSEVNRFVSSVSEVNGLKESVSQLHEKLVHRENDIMKQKNELDHLLSATNSLVSSIEEQTGSVKTELQKTADEFMDNIKSGISQIGSICDEGRDKLGNQHKEGVQNVAERYEEMQQLCQSLKSSVDAHEDKMIELKESYSRASSFHDKVNASLGEMKKTLYEFQKRPYEFEDRLRKMEERLEDLIEEKYARQKNHSLILFLIIVATALFSVAAFYLR